MSDKENKTIEVEVKETKQENALELWYDQTAVKLNISKDKVAQDYLTFRMLYEQEDTNRTKLMFSLIVALRLNFNRKNLFYLPARGGSLHGSKDLYISYIGQMEIYKSLDIRVTPTMIYPNMKIEPVYDDNKKLIAVNVVEDMDDIMTMFSKKIEDCFGVLVVVEYANGDLQYHVCQKDYIEKIRAKHMKSGAWRDFPEQMYLKTGIRSAHNKILMHYGSISKNRQEQENLANVEQMVSIEDRDVDLSKSIQDAKPKPKPAPVVIDTKETDSDVEDAFFTEIGEQEKEDE